MAVADGISLVRSCDQEKRHVLKLTFFSPRTLVCSHLQMQFCLEPKQCLKEVGNFFPI